MRNRVATWLNGFILRHKLTSAIGLVIIISIFLVGISMTLYVTGGTSGLDLSRPGFDVARKDVKEDKPTYQFPSTGKLTATDYKGFVEQYNDQVDGLDGIGNFDETAMTDEALGLTSTGFTGQ